MKALPALVVAALAAAPVAAGSSSPTTINRILSCPVRYGLAVDAWATDPRIDVAGVGLSIDHRSLLLLAFDTGRKGITVGTPPCRPVRRKIPLRRVVGLPSAATFTAGDYEGLDGRCPVSGRVVIHLRLRIDSGGTPLGGRLAVWRQAKVKTMKGTRFKRVLRPLAFIAWSPARTRTYLSSICY